jgi:murein DD-endopeptidase MepM/ murein hydrolase activator NlpD
VSRRRKRRSAEVRNSLRLFGLLAVLAGVNVYVFFFNRGTAPREVLKPSSMVRSVDGQGGTLKQAAAEAGAALSPSSFASHRIQGAGQDTGQDKKAKPPIPVAPSPATAESSKAKPTLNSSLASSGGPPKDSPGGSPGQYDGVPLNQAGKQQQISESDTTEANREKRFGESDTLGQVLAREGFEGEAGRVVAALSRLFDPKLIRGGQSYTVHRDEQGEPESFEYRPNAVTRYVATRGDTTVWNASREDQPLIVQVVPVSGTIDTSLYESVQGAGERTALAGLLVDLLAWDINFYVDTHPADHWKVIVEKEFLGGQFYRYGHILAAEYGGRVGTFRAFYWKANRPNTEGRYFDENGQAVSKTLLKTPLRYVRVSSKFDRHRFHPILHQERAHLGIDYAAPIGTPVWASSAGKVVACGLKRGSGNTVIVSHGNGMTTRYYHLSRFARGLTAGKLVRQKEVIGFVGTSGLSTGPHLHFSVTKNGAFVDPSKVKVNRDAPVVNRSGYLAAVRPRLAILRGLQPSALARN